MTNKRNQSRSADWDTYRSDRADSSQSMRRARDTHRERRALELQDLKDRTEGRQERVNELEITRRERAAELERARLDEKRRGVNPETERQTLAKGRRDAAADVRDQNLLRVERNRPDAITSVAQQAAQAHQEHRQERSVVNDPTSAEYRGLVEIKRDSAERLRQHRAERDAEDVKLAGERRIAAAHMAREARRTRMLREMEEETGLNSRETQLAEVGALAKLMSEVREEMAAEKGMKVSTPKPVERTPEQTEALIDLARVNIAEVRKAMSKPEAPESSKTHEKVGGLLSKLFGRKRRSA
ncbi:MAG: hypothetical protein HOB07_04520 [Chloroflexi bacterium]|nr:hypothetical protein [Chloroflexota bacterium]